MMRLREILHWHTVLGDEVTVGDFTVTPQSKALIVRFPHWGMVWNRPIAVLAHRGGQTERIRVVDVTRMAQLGLLGLSMLFFVVTLILSGRRRRPSDE